MQKKSYKMIWGVLNEYFVCLVFSTLIAYNKPIIITRFKWQKEFNTILFVNSITD